MLNDWNFWFSVITALIAIVAIFQTQKQITVSNKQSLFDRRINNYTITMELIQTYKGNQGLATLGRKNEPLPYVTLEFAWFTNNSYLKEIYEVIENPFSQPEQIKFTKKCGDLKEVAAVSKFIFTGEPAEFFNEFVLCYERLLFEMYQYQVWSRKLEEPPEQSGLVFTQAQKISNENRLRKELLEAYDKLNKSYDKIVKNDIIQRIEKQIRF